MMKRTSSGIIIRLISVILTVIILVSLVPVSAYASDDNTDPIIVVSLGDSYSSGEGIEPFYGQSKSDYGKVTDANWVAHRSEMSWPALLQVPTKDGGKSLPMSKYHVDVYQEGDVSSSADFEWYFVAASGATTADFKGDQAKHVNRYGYEFDAWLYSQLNVFNEIDGVVDYVTLTIGGNDVDFSEIITDCAMHSTYLGSTSLKNRLCDTWTKFYSDDANDDKISIRKKIKNAYKDVQEAAGEQAAIIVAGYPKLLEKNGKGAAISKEEATLVNEAVTQFNSELKSIVAECYAEGMRIYFADVEEEFDGHEAYSSDAWINPIWLRPRENDISWIPPSSYSMHPNKTGATHYADCVNKAIMKAYNDAQTSEVDPNNLTAGSIITFGSYPQSQVTDSATLHSLDAAQKNWHSYNYEIKSGLSSDYMQYCDVTIDDNKYRGVFFSEFRPYTTTPTTQLSNGFYLNTIYWFKYEPLKWIIIDASTGFIICETTIDCQPFSNYFISRNNKFYNEMGAYASDWETSSLRTWLNNVFFTTAFNTSEQSKIASKYHSNADGNHTNEAIYLLSQEEFENYNFGHISSSYAFAKGSDYAKCQGLAVGYAENTSAWLLRSAYDSHCVHVVTQWGDEYGTDVVYFASGVRPVLNLDLSALSTQAGN